MCTGLKAGEITVQHLMQQLGNPGLQSRHREVLLTILRLHQQQRQVSILNVMFITVFKKGGAITSIFVFLEKYYLERYYRPMNIYMH